MTMRRMMASFLLMKNIWDILSHKKHSFQQQQQHQAQAVIYLHIQMILSIKWKRSPTTTLCYNAKKSNWYSPFKQDMSLFTNVVTKVVGTCPFNINGNKIYQMICDESIWKEKLTDGRHWQINWGKYQLLNGERRVAKCQGSVVCTNSNCPMFQVHNIINEASFSCGTLEGSYQCANCLHFSERQWCSALRASKWDRERNIMSLASG